MCLKTNPAIKLSASQSVSLSVGSSDRQIDFFERCVVYVGEETMKRTHVKGARPLSERPRLPALPACLPAWLTDRLTH
jgi:hypothetical protein